MTQTRRITLAGLLLLLVTASGCGVALPTQPNTNDATVPMERSVRAGTLEASEPPMDIVDNSGQTGEVVPAPPVGESVIFLPPPNFGAGNHFGHAWGHDHKKPKL